MGKAFAHLRPETMSQVKRTRTFITLALMTLSAGALALVTAACSTPEYRYVPAQNQASGRQNKNLAVYPNPAGPNSGVVRIRSLGVVTLKSKTGDTSEFPAVHVRMSISNQTKVTWEINSRDQKVAFPNEGAISPILAESDSENPPVFQILPGQLRTLDLYFRLPADVSGAGNLPEFDFYWSFAAGPTEVAEMTPFERQRVPEQPAVVYPYYPPGPYLGWGWGWGPRWGYGPWW